MPASEQIDLAVEVFRMLSDSTRVRVLWALLDGEQSVNELAEAVDKAAATVSQHLAKLRMARLVHARRRTTSSTGSATSTSPNSSRTRSTTPSTAPAEFPSTTGSQPPQQSASSAASNLDQPTNP